MPIAKKGHFEPKKAVFGRFLDPPVTFLGGLMAYTDPPWEALKGPWRLQKSPKTMGPQIAFLANPNGLDIG